METRSVTKYFDEKRNVGNSKLLCNCSSKQSAERNSETKQSRTRLCSGNLFAAGNTWIQAVQSTIFDTRISLAETVQAADKPQKECKKKSGDEKPPERPKRMKFTELPLDKSPHADYKNYEFEKVYCCDIDRKLWHEFLQPYVVPVRKYTQETIQEYTTYIKQTYNDVKKLAAESFKEMCNTCRDDAYLIHRQIAVATAGGLGFLLTARKKPVYSKKILVGCLATSVAGALCFPKETDETIRSVGFKAAKTAIAAYNYYEGTNYTLKEPLPCLKTVPAMPPPRINKCGVARAKREAEIEAMMVKPKPKPT